MPGGVCAVLDYEVEAMAEYVADMATRVMTPEATVSLHFRKFVTQILTSTRLPRTTILLGMNYLAKRINMMKTQGPLKISEGQVWRLLTVALLLGSKFLDDNTFQNRSWSEVTGIDVKELNHLELEWVEACKWHLYVNLDNSKDYTAWLDNFEGWKETKRRQAVEARAARLASLPHLETGLGRIPTAVTSPRATGYPQRLSALSSADVARYNAKKTEMAVRTPYYQQPENAWATGQYRPQHPITPPDSGYSTPEYMSATSANNPYNDWFAQALQYNAGYPHNASQGTFYTRRGNYLNQYPYGPWEHTLGDCNCQQCAAPVHKPHYFIPHGFGQPVVG